MKAKLKVRLYKFQREDVDEAESRFQGRALIAHEQGLGKTITSYAYRVKYAPKGPCVIITAAGLKEQWRRELLDKFGEDAHILNGLAPRRLRRRGSPTFIINYDILGIPSTARKTWTEELIMLQPALVILDEIHFARNPRARRSKACRMICHAAPKRLGLSGTPQINRPLDLWHIAQCINPEVFPNMLVYGLRWCAGMKDSYGCWDFSGSSRERELHCILTNEIMLRRRKEDVLGDLPKKTRTVVPMELPPKAMTDYRRAVAEFLKWLAEKDRAKALRASMAEGFVKVGYLKRLAATHKLPQVIRWIEDFLDDTNQKLIVFGVTNEDFVIPLYERFRKSAVLVTGKVRGRHRQEAVDRFNSDPKIRLFIGNLLAAGTGWNCTSASNVLFGELDWVPGNHDQAESRCHGIRRGTGLPVSVNYTVAAGTIEETLCAINEKKMTSIAKTIDGEKGTDFKLFDQLVAALKTQGKTPTKGK